MYNYVNKQKAFEQSILGNEIKTVRRCNKPHGATTRVAVCQRSVRSHSVCELKTSELPCFLFSACANGNLIASCG